MDDAGALATNFTIFRRADIAPLTEDLFYGGATATPEQRASMDAMLAAGWADGEETRFLYNGPGFSLVHAWFKAGYPLPLHSHSGDCLYVVVSGSLSLGTEELHSGDGFFVPANAAYAYTPGPKGVEVLEFRHNALVDFRILAKGSAFWAKGLQRVVDSHGQWLAASRPGEAAARTEANRRTAIAVLEAVPRGELLRDLMTEDAVWWVPGRGDMTLDAFEPGLKGFIDLIKPDGRMIIHEITADGDRVAMETESLFPLKDGRLYNNTNHFLFEFRDGKVSKVKEYCDTALVAAIFAPPA
jgi:ketosteroid isomerase-like protein/quercetin dioxygenase-like cupin family protein